jgi:hypothetical protein
MKSLGAFVVLLAVASCAAPPATESEGRSSSHQLAGRIVPADELATALRSAGFDEATVPKMICTAKYESSFHEAATNSNSNGTTDYGIFQINTIHLGKTAGCPSSSNELMDVSTNAQCAFGVYSIQGLEAWVAYKSHRAECDAEAAPAGSADPNATDPNATDPNTDPNGTDPNAGDGGAGVDPKDPGYPGADPNDPGYPGGGDPCADPYAPGCQDDGWGANPGWAAAHAVRGARRTKVITRMRRR